MSELHLHLTGPAADHAEWTVDDSDADFDGKALEQAILDARRAAYAALRDLDAA